MTRSRSNSHSNKKEPKSGEGNNASVIQDSGFSTETSSSKETHSATSTNGTGVTTTIGGSNSSSSTSGFQRVSSHEAEDELWNLLDVIHRKSTRLRDEMEHLRLIENGGSKSPDPHHLHHDHDHQYIATHLTDIFQLELNRINGEDMVTLRKDRDRLLDKLAEMEAEVVAGRIRTNQMEDDVNALTLVKRDLEEQLRIALSQKLDLNTRLHDLISDRSDIPARYDKHYITHKVCSFFQSLNILSLSFQIQFYYLFFNKISQLCRYAEESPTLIDGCTKTIVAGYINVSSFECVVGK